MQAQDVELERPINFSRKNGILEIHPLKQKQKIFHQSTVDSHKIGGSALRLTILDLRPSDTLGF